jgi:hypothetical protein
MLADCTHKVGLSINGRVRLSVHARLQTGRCIVVQLVRERTSDRFFDVRPQKLFAWPHLPRLGGTSLPS